MRSLSLIAVAAVLATAPAVAGMPPEIVVPYLHIQLALANDSTDGVIEAAQSIATEAGQLGDEGKAVVMAAQVVVGANDLASTRVAFGPLSDALIEYAKEAGLGGAEDCLLSHGKEILGTERWRDPQPVLRFDDAELRGVCPVGPLTPKRVWDGVPKTKCLKCCPSACPVTLPPVDRPLRSDIITWSELRFSLVSVVSL